jgi:hypothetical protein
VGAQPRDHVLAREAHREQTLERLGVGEQRLLGQEEERLGRARDARVAVEQEPHQRGAGAVDADHEDRPLGRGPRLGRHDLAP